MTKKTPAKAQVKRTNRQLAAADRIIQEEIERIGRSGSSALGVGASTSEIENRVVEAVCEKIRQSDDRPFYTDAFALLGNLVRRLVPEIDGAKRIFARIRETLVTIYNERGESHIDVIGSLKWDLLLLDQLAQDYFYEVLSKEFNSNDPIQMLEKAQAKMTLTDAGDGWIIDALSRIKDRTNEEIEWRTQLEEKRAKLAGVVAPLNGSTQKEELATTEDGQRSYEPHPEMTLDRAILMLNMIVPGFARAGDKKTKARFLRFLTGLGKPDSDYARQRLSIISRKHIESPEAFRTDMKVINKRLSLLGLSPTFDEHGNRIKQ